MKNMICIICPRGCHLCVDEENGYTVTGFGCERGEKYGRKELINPTRMVTSTVRLKGGAHPRCPVKTSRDIPRGLIKEAMKLLDDVELQSPVRVGDVVLANILGIGADFVVTRDM